jgi:hypothetical protein
MAVKMVVYRDGNGGMLNILDRGDAKRLALYKKPNGGVSGIRRRRYVSPETKRSRGYRGADRAFILRFINSGTEDRYTKVRRQEMKKSPSKKHNYSGCLRRFRSLHSTNYRFSPTSLMNSELPSH